MKIYWNLFHTFAKIGLFTFGGGYAMLPLMEKEIAERRKWAASSDILDYYALAQCTPGIIAVNLATFIGYQKKRWLGAICATAGVIFPSLIIILGVASLLQNLTQYHNFQHALAGIRVSVCALILKAILQLKKSSITDHVTSIMFFIVLGANILLPLSPVWYVLCAALTGILMQVRKGAL